MINWSPGVSLDQVEKQVVLKAYDHYRRNKTTTANSLGISIRTLDSKLEKYEQEELAAVEAAHAERQQRTELLNRSRGINTEPTIDTRPTKANEGISLESLMHPTPEHVMSMQERQEVQDMLPSKSSKSSPRKFGA